MAFRPGSFRKKALLAALVSALSLAASLRADQTVQVGPGNAFSPAAVTVAPGEAVIWSFQAFHTATSDATTGPEVWDSGFLSTGTFSHTFTTPGSYPVLLPGPQRSGGHGDERCCRRLRRRSHADGDADRSSGPAVTEPDSIAVAHVATRRAGGHARTAVLFDSDSGFHGNDSVRARPCRRGICGAQARRAPVDRLPTLTRRRKVRGVTWR